VIGVEFGPADLQVVESISCPARIEARRQAPPGSQSGSPPTRLPRAWGRWRSDLHLRPGRGENASVHRTLVAQAIKLVLFSPFSRSLYDNTATNGCTRVARIDCSIRASAGTRWSRS